MRALIKLVFILIAAGFALGVYFKLYEEEIVGERIIGISVLASAFILMPLFLAHRWKGKRLQDYTLTKENIERMNNKNSEESDGESRHEKKD
ncbi:membrane protein [Psychroflexus tropicus]|uniref:membrane protein n=1 Tax=Psychroflexus tropicus TaxID=197345 RepID=UPI000363BC96|nr:membrane protein [Psychroflexus tropicus]